VSLETGQCDHALKDSASWVVLQVLARSLSATDVTTSLHRWLIPMPDILFLPCLLCVSIETTTRLAGLGRHKRRRHCLPERREMVKLARVLLVSHQQLKFHPAQLVHPADTYLTAVRHLPVAPPRLKRILPRYHGNAGHRAFARHLPGLSALTKPMQLELTYISSSTALRRG